jgi:uncharacterized OB-fold protein
MSEDVQQKAMPSRGKLYSFTSVHVGPTKWRRPLNVGYVDLENGVRVFAHLQGSHFAFDQAVDLDVANVGVTAEGVSLQTFVFKNSGVRNA